MKHDVEAMTLTDSDLLGEGAVACRVCGERFVPQYVGEPTCCDECRLAE